MRAVPPIRLLWLTSGDCDRNMRLLDQIAQASAPLEIVDVRGVQRLPCARDHRRDVVDCPLRFVLDQTAADRCFDLLRSDAGMLAAENSFLRVPATNFWMEWPCRPSDGAGARSGLLVEADGSGRRGRILTFWEQADGEPVPAQAAVAFDLENACSLQEARGRRSALLPGSHPLASNLMFVVDDAWMEHLVLGGAEAVRRSMRAIAANLLAGVEFLFVFSALLSERTELAREPIDLSALNRQRTKRGRPPLLDHVEVRLDLSALPGCGVGGAEPVREAPRLHVVRGHMVRRQRATF